MHSKFCFRKINLKILKQKKLIIKKIKNSQNESEEVESFSYHSKEEYIPYPDNKDKNVESKGMKPTLDIWRIIYETEELKAIALIPNYAKLEAIIKERFNIEFKKNELRN